MSRIIDLTHPITHGMPVFPGDPEVNMMRHHNYQNGYFVSRIDFGVHTGTHIDAPAHVIPGGTAVDGIPIARFISRAYVMDLPDAGPDDVISRAHLLPFADNIEGIHAVIIRTGWSAHFGSEDFFTRFPSLDESAADWLCSSGIQLLGLETPSVSTQQHLEIHERLLSCGIIIVESLNNVDALRSKYVTLFAVPLRLDGLDGSPVRAYAVEE